MMAQSSSIRLLKWTLGIVAMLALMAGRSETAEEPKAGDPESQMVLNKLKEKITFQFPEQTPLWDVVNYMSIASRGPTDKGIPFDFDEDSLKEAGKTRHSLIPIPINGDFTNEAVLKKLLKPMGLIYSVKKGVLVIAAGPRSEK